MGDANCNNNKIMNIEKHGKGGRGWGRVFTWEMPTAIITK